MSDAPEKPAIFIPAPASKDSGQLAFIEEFHLVAAPTQASVIGQTPNTEEFSKPLPDDNDRLAGVVIKTPGADGYYIPPQFEQFAPSLRLIVDDYHKRFGDDGYCQMSVTQAKALPRSKEGPVLGPHRDGDFDELFKTGKTANQQTYIVSDVPALTTPFYASYTPTQEHADRIKNSDDKTNVQASILKEFGGAATQKAAYAITHFDSTTPHGIANPQEEADRTTLVVLFLPKDNSFIKPENVNNPWLEAAIAQKNSAGEKSAPAAGKTL